MNTINPAQRIQLERLKLGSFNEFDGEQVAQDLEEHSDLWQSFVFGRFKYSQLIELRDLHGGDINADAIYALVPKNKLDSFLKMAKKWKPNELGYYYQEGEKTHTEGTVSYRSDELHMALGACLEKNQILIRLWWD